MGDQELFEPFPKIARLFRDCTITEKIDGTNAQVIVTEDGSVLAGSRTRLISTHADNHGFARWVAENEDDLKTLGVGRHFGEWWGSGIQRGYRLKEKRFSLFNVKRWSEVRPACCHVVPTLYAGPFDTKIVRDVLHELKTYGSYASPGFMKPEGIIVWHDAARQFFKITCEKDEAPKSLVA